MALRMSACCTEPAGGLLQQNWPGSPPRASHSEGLRPVDSVRFSGDVPSVPDKTLRLTALVQLEGKHLRLSFSCNREDLLPGCYYSLSRQQWLEGQTLRKRGEGWRVGIWPPVEREKAEGTYSPGWQGLVRQRDAEPGAFLSLCFLTCEMSRYQRRPGLQGCCGDKEERWGRARKMHSSL